MGLDIYVGTLTRYYTHNWKTATQQWTEGNGYGFSRITAERDFFKKKKKLSPASIQADMENWRNQILKAITPSEKQEYVPWEENNEATPYYTNVGVG